LDPTTYTFNYQRDTYTVANVTSDKIVFHKLPYPSTDKPPLNTFLKPKKLGLGRKEVDELTELYGKNEFNIPIPSFTELFSEHATAPFFVFQVSISNSLTGCV